MYPCFLKSTISELFLLYPVCALYQVTGSGNRHGAMGQKSKCIQTVFAVHIEKEQ